MARGDRDVLHPRGLRQRNPGLSVKLLGIEERRQPIVLVYGELAIVEYPFAVAENAVHAPVDEHSELVVLELLTSFEIFRRGLVRALRRLRSHQNGQKQYDTCEQLSEPSRGGHGCVLITRSDELATFVAPV